MTPINDPRKLELMRCAYQRAVSPCSGRGESLNCPNCDKRFNRFYLGTPDPSSSQESYRGWKVYYYGPQSGPGERPKAYAVVLSRDPNDPSNAGVEFYDKETGERITDPQNLQPVLKANDLSTHTQKTGLITSECLYSPCWFCIGRKCDVPKCCQNTGKYCGTYIWVPESGVDELTKLTMAILDYAFYDPVAPPKPAKKQVEFYLDETGKVATKDGASYKVSAEIGLDEDVRTLTQSQDALLALQSEVVEILSANPELSLNIESLNSNQFDAASPEAKAAKRLRNTLKLLDQFDEVSPPSPTIEQIPTPQPTRLPTPSLLELEQQLQNISPRPAP